MICSGKKKGKKILQFANQSAICHTYKANDSSLLKGLPTVCKASLEIQALCQAKVYALTSYLSMYGKGYFDSSKLFGDN